MAELWLMVFWAGMLRPRIVHSVSMCANADPDLRSWFLRHTAIEAKFLDRVMAICDEEMIGTVGNLRVATRAGLLPKIFRPMVAVSIERALDTEARNSVAPTLPQPPPIPPPLVRSAASPPLLLPPPPPPPVPPPNPPRLAPTLSPAVPSPDATTAAHEFLQSTGEHAHSHGETGGAAAAGCDIAGGATAGDAGDESRAAAAVAAAVTARGFEMDEDQKKAFAGAILVAAACAFYYYCSGGAVVSGVALGTAFTPPAL
eukprot:scaffold3917_cov113-Isochrysis_galbana.AAC.4